MSVPACVRRGGFWMAAYNKIGGKGPERERFGLAKS
jgi:hypothetical protein